MPINSSHVETSNEPQTTDADGTKGLAFEQHFKKVTNQKVQRNLQHPLYTLQKKFDFLNRHTPLINGPSPSRSLNVSPENTSGQNTAEEQLFNRMKVKQKKQEKKKEEDLKKRVR